MGASQMPCGSGVTKAGQRKKATTKSTHIALTSLESAFLDD